MDQQSKISSGGGGVGVEIVMNGGEIGGEVEKKEVAAATASAGLGCKEKLCISAGAIREQLQRLPLDWICLSVVMLFVWTALLLPIIYFHTEIVSVFVFCSSRSIAS